VTGGGSGIGAQVAKDLVEKGAIVYILGRRENILDKQVSIIKKNELHQKKIFSIKCDVSSMPQVKKAFSHILKQSGLVYGLINNAGINPSRNTILNTEEVDWKNTIDVNLNGAYNCSKNAIEHMKQLRKGTIVMISSVAGINAMKQRAAYSASKAGLLGLMRNLAIDYADKNIRVNGVCPGYVKTKLVEDYLNNMDKNEYKRILSNHPLGGIGSVNDVANAVLFFLSDNSKWVTGTILPVDGGYSMGRDYK